MIATKPATLNYVQTM